MSSDLQAVREVWATRSRARTGGEILYLLYVGVLSVLIFGLPALRSAGNALARPDVLPWLRAADSGTWVVAGALAVAGALVMLGAVRGPALLAPFFTATLASSRIRRRDVLWRPLLRALLVPLLGSVVLAALVGATLVSAGSATAAAVVWAVPAAVGTGLLLGCAWLVGEVLPAVPRRLTAAALLLAAVLCAVLPVLAGPGALLAADVPVAARSLCLLAAGLLGLAVSIPSLDRIRGQVLAEQSTRWETAATIATTGDMVSASGMFRSPPSAGRRLPAVGGGPLAMVFARRDAVAWLRSPERLVIGIGLGLTSAVALAASGLVTGPVAWTVALLGGAGLWAASGVFVDGIRHGVHTLGAPPLFGPGAGEQVLLHALAPTVMLSVLAVLGGVVPGLLSGAEAPGGALLPLALVPVLVAGRARDAAKGPMPLILITPMPTPQGDMAVLPMLAWQSDAILLALVATAVLVVLVPHGIGAVLVGTLTMTALTALMAVRRLRALRD